MSGLPISFDQPGNAPQAGPVNGTQAAQGADGRACPYQVKDGALVWQKFVGGQDPEKRFVNVPLTNFEARIVADVADDDGVEVQRSFEIEVVLAGRKHRIVVPSGQFASMNWPLEHLGAAAIVQPGSGVRDHARVAIQTLSGAAAARRVYSHTGWRRLETGGWGYLHARGAVGADGISVRLEGGLSKFALPEVPSAADAKAAVQASLKMLDLLPDRISVPVYAAIWRSVLAPCDFALHLCGHTGSGKSCIAALAQQHFGAEFDFAALPENWDSTGNRIAATAFSAKDALLVVDDFAPAGNQSRVEQKHAEADRVFRGQGNRSGRGRCRPDGSARPEKPPRGLILSTGEDVPRGESLRSRMLVLEVSPGMVPFGERLSSFQSDAAAGRYASAMSAFLAWLAPRYDSVLDELRPTVAQFRSEATVAGAHARTPGIVANLMAGFDRFVKFAVGIGAVPQDAAAALLTRAWTALGEAAAEQAGHLLAEEPTQRFIALLSGAIASGAAHLADATRGDAPPNDSRWGWRDHVACGARIGWTDDADLFLEAEAAYSTAQRLARDQGSSISIGPRTLWRRLGERGLLASTDGTRHTTVRLVCGARRRVLHLPASLLFPQNGDNGVFGAASNEINALRTDLFTDPAPASRTSVSNIGDKALLNHQPEPLSPISPIPAHKKGSSSPRSEDGGVESPAGRGEPL